MNDDRGCNDCGGSGRKGMSRAEFLSGGAVAAAAASLGGLGVISAEQAQRPPAVSVQQDCRSNCLSKIETWSVPASILNALWSDCFPRLVAKYWLLGGLPSLSSPSLETVLGAEMRTFLDKLADDIAQLTGSCRFVQRRDAVVTYLKGSNSPRIPIRFIDAGGFDFVLSDWGLDLFAPPRPEKPEEILLYYTYRKTGNAAIGIPDYLANAVPAVDISAPTGPSQAFIDPTIIVRIINDAARNETITDECAQMAVMCLRAGILRVDPDPPAHFDPYGTGSVGRVTRPTRLPPGGDTARIDTLRLGGGENIVGRLPTSSTSTQRLRAAVSMDTVRCVLDPVRCWQISGAVFRGLQVELPRVVATKWLEESLGATTTTRCYSQRLQGTAQAAAAAADAIAAGATTAAAAAAGAAAGAAEAASELRAILMERLETALPDDKAMVFAFRPDIADITVTNRGLFFPALTPAPTSDAPMSPFTVNEMLQQMVDGDAANPVFTDSVRSE
jgi:hypothetical protein